ncbi:MAG: GDSL-type esterase/lipase family protein [Planctomycetaceae bacterium]
MRIVSSLAGLLICLTLGAFLHGDDPAPRKPARSKPAARPQGGEVNNGSTDAGRDPRKANLKDARNSLVDGGKTEDAPELGQYAIYGQSAPRPAAIAPVETVLPLQLHRKDRIAYIGNTLLDRDQYFGSIETLIQQRFPEHQLTFRNLSWSADAIDSQPRPENFADVEQHLLHERADVIFAAYGYNESFAGAEGLEKFRENLSKYVEKLKSRSYNGTSAPRVVLISPIANEDIAGVPAATLNNGRIQQYAAVMKEVAAAQKVGFLDVFADTKEAMESTKEDLTINGAHLNEAGYDQFANSVFQGLFGETPPQPNPLVRGAVINKDRQFFRRHRPANSFYYTGGRRKAYGYLDFLPAMRNFDLMVENRDQVIWQAARGELDKEMPPLGPDARFDDPIVTARVNKQLSPLDAAIPPLPEALQSRGANEWLSAADELKAFEIDPRFEVNLFAGEEQFPDIACPIQMRWDARGRLWVACSTTYPHVYPGNEPNDKIVILEDTDGDGRADKSTLFADDLHIPLSFEFGDGGVYVSEMPDLTFLKDTDGDGKADLRRRVLHGFGTEDSHHALHDIIWTPDGDLIWRESVFHHSQVETPYGPVRQQNSGWFRYQPRNQRLMSFGTYSSTNPWGVTFDDWGQHVASHPVYAAAFHSLDPPYPTQHPAPKGLRAYSGVCGHQFVQTDTFPAELQGHMIKVRYKPTNRVEILAWKEGEFGFDEEYVSDLIFSKNLSFIPVDLQFGPRGDLYVCDWYNPVKGHAQYSLRDDRRDRHSGRIWRITAKGKPLSPPPNFAQASIDELLELLKRQEPNIRYWAKQELRERSANDVAAALETWVNRLDTSDPRHRHHQTEALWVTRWIGAADNIPSPAEYTSSTAQSLTHQGSRATTEASTARTVSHGLLRQLLVCEDPHARAAATQQLRYFWPQLEDHIALLRTACNDANGVVRMEAAIAASYIGSKSALDATLDLLKHPREGHVDYALNCALGSSSLKRHWENNPNYNIAKLLKASQQNSALKEPAATASEAAFDSQANLKRVRIGCVPERMKFTVERIDVLPGQPVKVVFVNSDATDHNLLFVQPGTLADVGIAANEMAKDRKNANSDFIPETERDKIIEAGHMIGPTRRAQIEVLRFNAPTEPGVYPYVCTFPGHWVIMNGVMIVANDSQQAEELLAASQPRIVQEWKLSDFAGKLQTSDDEAIKLNGLAAFVKARCNQCHQHSGKGVNLGPDLTKIGERFQGEKLLQHILEPSQEISKNYQTWQIITTEGKIITGFIKEENEKGITLVPNLLTPDITVTVGQREVELKQPSTVSSMPAGMLNTLTRTEIEALISWLQAKPESP